LIKKSFRAYNTAGKFILLILLDCETIRLAFFQPLKHIVHRIHKIFVVLFHLHAGNHIHQCIHIPILGGALENDIGNQGAIQVVHDIFRRIQQEPYDRSIEQKLRQENGERERQKQAAEKKIKAAQYKQKRYEDEVIRCLDGQSRFSEEMLARLIAEAETEVRQAKEEYAELLRNDTTRATIQQIRSYYDEFLGWANEFDLATIPRKRAILGQLIEKVEVGKGYKVTVHLRMSYAQFLGIEGNGEIQVRKDVCA
jgi:small-conductance mechanosensitive channel